MSGRLVILPKKTYCPWKPENVERVLRDERLERERLEREAKQNQSQSTSTLVRRRTGTNNNNDDGHINLFPEAKDAELNLVRGTNEKTISTKAVDYIPDAPLGGDEARRRKSGIVPFYMRSISRSNEKDNSSGGERYDNNGSSFRLGVVRKKGNADVITEQITRDQYARREDDRKGRLDPMNQFFKSSSTIKRDDAIIGEKVNGEDTQRKIVREKEKKASQERVEYASRYERHRHQTKSRRKRSREISSDDNKRRRHRHKSSSHRDINNAIHEKTNGDEIKTQQSDHNNSELEELRRRRHVREAREMERERHVIKPPHLNTAHGANVYNYSRDGKYQDQFNPTLSRN